jgi:hypothetical protein
VAQSHKALFRHESLTDPYVLERQTSSMPDAAPRYHPKLLELIAALDDSAQPIAETWRRAGKAAEELGLSRPSYVHVRRIVVAERAAKRRRKTLREPLVDVAVTTFAGGSPDIRRLLDNPSR